MDIVRTIAICIVLIIPTFVGGGAVWDITHGTWFFVFLWVAVMAVVAFKIVSKIGNVAADHH